MNAGIIYTYVALKHLSRVVVVMLILYSLYLFLIFSCCKWVVRRPRTHRQFVAIDCCWCYCCCCCCCRCLFAIYIYKERSWLLLSTSFQVIKFEKRRRKKKKEKNGSLSRAFSFLRPKMQMSRLGGGMVVLAIKLKKVEERRQCCIYFMFFSLSLSLSRKIRNVWCNYGNWQAFSFSPPPNISQLWIFGFVCLFACFFSVSIRGAIASLWRAAN